MPPTMPTRRASSTARPHRGLSLRAAAALVVLSLGVAVAQDNGAADPTRPDPLIVRVKSVRIEGLTGKGLTAEQVLALPVKLRDVAHAHTAPARDGPLVELTGGTRGAGSGVGRPLDASAIQHVLQTISTAFSRRGQAAVRVFINQSDLDRLQRPDGDGVLVIHIEEGVVGAVMAMVDGGETPPPAPPAPPPPATVDATAPSAPTASVDPAAAAAAVDDAAASPAPAAPATPDSTKPGRTKAEQRIAENSPVQSGDVIDLPAIERYTRMLERSPHRRVDATLAPGLEPGTLQLEYLVSQRNPLVLYAQASNTGTPETSEWRQRFGLTHYDLTGHDDVLSLDYNTGNFDAVHAFTGSYGAPLPALDRPDLRFKVFGSWNQYDASQVGLPDANFTGEGFDVGGELQWTFAQRGEWFFDLVPALRFKHVETENQLAAVSANADFLLPSLSVQADRRAATASTFAALTLETNLPSLIGTDQDEVEQLGRTGASDDFTTLRLDASHSFYLEPLLIDGWGPGQAGSTLAHEIYGSLRGQVSLDRRRLAPNFTEVAGGFYSVRGYPESFISGDDAVIATLEYRLHVPALLPPADEPITLFGQPFRARPQGVLGPLDWDLILRAFVDAGVVHQVDKLSFESNATLLSAGVGAELTLRPHATVRVDWGFPLRDTENGDEEVTVGSSQVHLLFSLSF